MDVSRQQAASNDDAQQAPAVEKGPRARTKRLMLETATRLMQSGVTPSVSEVAEAATQFCTPTGPVVSAAGQVVVV